MTCVIIIHSLLQLYQSLTVTRANTTDVIFIHSIVIHLRDYDMCHSYSFVRLRLMSFLFIREITTYVILILSRDYVLHHSYSFTRLRLMSLLFIDKTTTYIILIHPRNYDLCNSHLSTRLRPL